MTATTRTSAYNGQDLSRDSLFIDGTWSSPVDGDEFGVISPSTEEVFATSARAGLADVERAVEAARTAFDHGSWPRLSARERADVLSLMADALDERSELLRLLSGSECGATVPVAEGFASSGVSLLSYYAHAIRSYQATEHVVGELSRAEVRRLPVGVAAIVIPWNAPLSIAFFSLAPALAAGCTVVLKSPTETPLAVYVLGDIAAAAGLPPGVLNIVSADRDVSESLIRNPSVDTVCFTGSTAVGRRIGAICGERLVSTTLELGGKSAALVLEDSDPAVIAQTLAPTTMLHNGQLCTNPTRVLVPRRQHGKFVDALTAAVSGFAVGDPFDPSTFIGPVISAAQRSRIEGYIAGAVDDGARALTGGGRRPELERGFYVAPTLFDKVDSSMTIAHEEVFGPVVVVIDYDDEDDAIRIANDSQYGLSGNVWSPDIDRAQSVARQIRSGQVGINGNFLDWAIPFGGMKQSGIGRELGTAGLDAFHEVQAVHRAL